MCARRFLVERVGAGHEMIRGAGVRYGAWCRYVVLWLVLLLLVVVWGGLQAFVIVSVLGVVDVVASSVNYRTRVDPVTLL